MLGDKGADILFGRDGNDTLDGGEGDDVHLSGAGNDLFIANIGNDIFDGGIGVDVIDYRASSAGVNVDLDAGTASGGSAEGDRLINIESVQGSAFADVIAGDDPHSRILGNYGADTLSGGQEHYTIRCTLCP